jgi:hypothetical protein
VSLMLAMGEYDEDEDLHDSAHQNVIPYVYERMRFVLQCVVQALAWHLVALDSGCPF